MCSDDVCVLSASGTAAVVNVRSSIAPPPVSSDTPEPAPANPPLKQNNNMTSSLDRTEFERQGSLTQSTPLKSEVSFSFYINLFVLQILYSNFYPLLNLVSVISTHVAAWLLVFIFLCQH